MARTKPHARTARRIGACRRRTKKEYDFSAGVRGKFFRRGARLRLPVYLDDEAYAFVQAIAVKKGMDISAVVNQMLLTDKRLVEMGG